MKNTIFSIVLAFLVLTSTAFALGESVKINSTSIYPSSTIYFSGTKDGYDNSGKLVSNQGVLPLVNKLNGSVTVSFGSLQLVNENDASLNVNITNQAISLSAFETNNNNRIKLSTTKNIESGIYDGKMQIVNDSNPSQILDEVPLKVLLPAAEITDIIVKDVESDSTDTKLEKGQKFTVTIDYKNIADQTDLENINVKATVYSGDNADKLTDVVTNQNGDDLQDDKDVSDLSNGKTGTATFTFEMPFDMSDGDKFTILAEMTANGKKTSVPFYAKRTKGIEGSVPNDKIAITKLSALPATFACGAATNRTRISYEITNTGDNSQDVQLFLRNLATGSEHVLNNGEDLALGNDFSSSNSDFTQQGSEYVTLNDLKEGQNTYTLVAYYNSGSLTVQQDVVITSQSCGTTTSSNNVVVVPTNSIPTSSLPNVPTSAISEPVSNPTYVSLKDVSSGFNSDLVLPIAIGVGGLVIGVIVALLVIPRG